MPATDKRLQRDTKFSQRTFVTYTTKDEWETFGGVEPFGDKVYRENFVLIAPDGEETDYAEEYKETIENHEGSKGNVELVEINPYDFEEAVVTLVPLIAENPDNHYGFNTEPAPEPVKQAMESASTVTENTRLFRCSQDSVADQDRKPEFEKYQVEEPRINFSEIRLHEREIDFLKALYDLETAHSWEIAVEVEDIERSDDDWGGTRRRYLDTKNDLKYRGLVDQKPHQTAELTELGELIARILNVEKDGVEELLET